MTQNLAFANERTTMGARYDKHENFEENISPRAYLLKCIKAVKMKNRDLKNLCLNMCSRYSTLKILTTLLKATSIILSIDGFFEKLTST